MKRLLYLLLGMSTLASAAEPIVERAFPSGKPSVDFFSGKQLGSGVVGDNLIRKPEIAQFSPAADALWRNTWSIQASGDEQKSIRSRITHHYTPETGAVITIAPDAEQSASGGENRGIFTQTIPLPASNAPVEYRFSLECRGTDDPAAKVAPQIYAMLRPLDKDGQLLRSANRGNVLRLASGSDWQRAELRLTMPPECRAFQLSLNRAGAGTAAFRNLELLRQAKNDAVQAMLSPMGFYDNEFHIGANSAGRPDILVLNPAQKQCSTSRLSLKLPPGIRLDAVSTPFTATPGQEAGSYAIALPTLSGASHAIVKLLISNTLPVGTRATATLRYADESGESAPVEFTFVSVERRTAPQPERFESGIATSGVRFPAGTDLTPWGTLLQTSGVNAMREADSVTPEIATALRNAKLKVYLHSGILCNGYRIGGADKPAHTLFRGLDGNAVCEGTLPGICPQEVIENGATYRAAIAAVAARLGKQGAADGVMSNWEPFYYDFKGCFCPRCRTAFAAYAKLEPAQLDAVWPETVMQQHRDLWSSFRSDQHARMLRRIDTDLGAAGSDFAPMLSAPGLNGLPDSHSTLYRAADYLPHIRTVNAWGPYQTVTAGEPYLYQSGWLLAQQGSARRVRAYTDSIASQTGKQPVRLLAAPHSMQFYNWVTPPEALAFQTVLYFLNRWDGSFAYYFPCGYDQRYWNALADANLQIATHEAMLDGALPATNVTAEALTPLPAPAASLAAQFPAFPELRQGESLMQYFAFRKGDAILAAVGNFWQLGELFFRLKLQDLPATTQYTVTTGEAPQILLLSPSGNPTWSGAELANGILLQVGAWQFRFVRIEPGDKATLDMPRISQQQLESLQQERRDGIARAMTRETALAAAHTVAPLPELSGDGFHAAPAAGLWEVRNGKNLWRIAPDSGAQLVSWELDGKEQLLSATPSAVDTFLRLDGKNTVQLRQQFKPGKSTLQNGELTAEFTRDLTGMDHAQLDGLRLTRRYRFRRNNAGFRLDVELENRSAQPRLLHYGQLYQLQSLASAGNQPLCRLSSQEFSRNFKPQFYRTAPDRELERNFTPDTVKTIDAPLAEFPSFEVACQPQEAFAGFIFWDRGHQAASTFEPAFRAVTLNSGAKVTYSTTFQVKSR